MKTSSLFAIALFGFISTKAHAAEWVQFHVDAANNATSYDKTSVQQSAPHHRSVWARYQIHPQLHQNPSSNARFDEVRMLWLYDCQGNIQTQEQHFYLQGKNVLSEATLAP
ncbi:MAG: hypothetical protein Q4E16_06340, partial [Neisseria sp.]|nr:hypothetical protein [Neisseria sp.]